MSGGFDQFVIGRSDEAEPEGSIAIEIPVQSAIATVILAMRNGHHYIACDFIGQLSVSITEQGVKDHVLTQDFDAIWQMIERAREKPKHKIMDPRLVFDGTSLLGFMSPLELGAIAESVGRYGAIYEDDGVNKTVRLWERAAEELIDSKEWLALSWVQPEKVS